LANSLGEVETIIQHYGFDDARRALARKTPTPGVIDSLIQISIGIEDAHNLIVDLQRALDNITII
jgi:cystathionine beta-lyase/cystathionine gamma-synthase